MTRGGQPCQATNSLQSLITELKSHDCSIADDIIQQILSYGSEAMPVLSEILEDALRCVSDKRHFPPKNTEWFVAIHALYLLAHLHASEAIDVVLRFLGQKQDILDHWLHDLLDEDLWEVFFLLGQDKLNRFEDFMLEPHNNPSSKLAMATALVQIALHDYDKAAKVRRVFENVLRQANEDPDFVGLVASELMDLLDPELRQAILTALDDNNVWPGIISAKEVEANYQRGHKRKIEPLSIFERYASFREHAYFAPKQQKALQRQTGKKPKVEQSA